MTYDKNSIEFVSLPTNPRFVDLTDRRFTRLMVLGYAGIRTRNAKMWWVECDCGTIKKVGGAELKNGDTQSCRCLHRDIMATHGESPFHNPSPEYSIYKGAKGRCENPDHQSYAKYGGRGIKFLYISVEQFIQDVGRRPTPRHTLERKDNERGYEPGNCCWATMAEQMRNTRRTHRITIDGVTKCRTDWCEYFGIDKDTASGRHHRGWCDACLFLPLGSACVHKPRRIFLGRRSDNHFLVLNGKSQTIASWSRELNINATTLSARIHLYGWSEEKTLTTPVRSKSKP